MILSSLPVSWPAVLSWSTSSGCVAPVNTGPSKRRSPTDRPVLCVTPPYRQTDFPLSMSIHCIPIVSEYNLLTVVICQIAVQRCRLLLDFALWINGLIYFSESSFSAVLFNPSIYFGIIDIKALCDSVFCCQSFIFKNTCKSLVFFLFLEL